jgi:hypothetical protein
MDDVADFVVDYISSDVSFAMRVPFMVLINRF